MPEAWFEALPGNVVIGDIFNIKGTVYDRNLESYKLSALGFGEESVIGEGTHFLYKDVLGVLNTQGLTQGEYTLKLEGKDRSGNMFETTSNIILESKPIVKINSPADRVFARGNA